MKPPLQPAVSVPVFAVSGNPPNFFASPLGKDRLNGPQWLAGIGLQGLEISCTHGVNISDDRADAYRANAAAHGIRLFVHAPYYINLAGGDPGVVQRSRQRVIDSMTLAARLGASRVVFHPGGYPDKGPGGREAALARLIDALRSIPVTWDPASVRLCAEIGGKVAALGSLDEIIDICKAVPWVSPCIDFAHLHARTNGGLPDVASHVAVIGELERTLGRHEVDRLHCHVYSVAYNEKGERHHLRFEPDGSLAMGEGGPDVRHFLAAVRETGISPSVICEGRDSQDIGARLMQRWWNEGVWGLPAGVTNAPPPPGRKRGEGADPENDEPGTEPPTPAKPPAAKSAGPEPAATKRSPAKASAANPTAARPEPADAGPAAKRVTKSAEIRRKAK